jgi:hypothetical protein
VQLPSLETLDVAVKTSMYWRYAAGLDEGEIIEGSIFEWAPIDYKLFV